MNDKEVMQALLSGKKLKDDCWDEQEFVYLDSNGKIRDESGLNHGLELRSCNIQVYDQQFEKKKEDSVYSIHKSEIEKSKDRIFNELVYLIRAYVQIEYDKIKETINELKKEVKKDEKI